MTRAKRQRAMGTITDKAQGWLGALRFGQRALAMLTPFLWTTTPQTHSNISNDKFQIFVVPRKKLSVPGPTRP